ncbi:PA0069 family radical SAM protein [Marinomonas posidonica]|uniref:Radical SAM domain protein n=1 Tax=Marinomonas posidonica (strain CECT 7376 / NCIMB 14433 / IVIA-Po-181) TaxID=491952 RepID=F6CSK4_MARPP|nr:PA0069 family radical SAM protein [Marinomonas posidonica]AEF56162.1 Radical SAM domain protein [Marinomonas posidonica IVIA-Po-181]
MSSSLPPFPSSFRSALDAPIKGRGTSSSLEGRFAKQHVELDENDDNIIARDAATPATQVRHESAKSLIRRNTSPDVPFNLSINPYQGCEHGCIYCFARPTHAYLDLSPGLDFETKLVAKTNAAFLFEEELSNPNYRCEPIALGINTDAYQPIEKQLGITRDLLTIALAHKQPISLITKSTLILRDLDVLAEMAKQGLIHVAISVTTLDNDLKRILEPRTASGQRRLEVIRQLKDANIPVTVLAAPVIPFINDHELENIIAASAAAGAQAIHYIMLRLPHEVAPLFREWLHQHYPERADHVLQRIMDMRGGKLYDSRFGKRMTGEGLFADVINQRFRIARNKHGLSDQRTSYLNCRQFAVPPKTGDQMGLF